ncbi:MAG: cysteine-rich CWC family protein [Burkholderiaceae bacterium]|nr:cysteine-rich CWC family protein [Burkholderiaceae bacterium]
MAAGLPAEHCWCMTATFSPTVLAALPDTLRGKVCICPRCADADACTTP